MNKILSTIFFMIIFFIAFLGMHFYVFYKLFSLLHIGNFKLIYILTFSFPIFFLLSKIIVEVSPNTLTKVLNYFSFLFLGIVFLLFSTFLISEIINFFIKTNPVITGFTVITIVTILSVFSMINAQKIYTKVVELKSDKIKQNYTIVQLSDTHFGSTSKNFNKKIINITNSINPDIILITGDFFDVSYLNQHDLEIYNNLKAPVYYSTGNHEFYIGINKTMSLLSSTKFKVLRNETVNFKELEIIGIDDSNDEKILEKSLSNINIDKNKYSILMFHRPRGFEKAVNKNIDLMLSGHTHIGQIFPFNFLVRLDFKYLKGLYKKDKSCLYISSGTGYWGPAMRLGSKNEITLIKLLSH